MVQFYSLFPLSFPFPSLSPLFPLSLTDEAAARILEAEIRATQQIAESLASAVAHSPAEAVAINGNKLAYELETLVSAAKKGKSVNIRFFFVLVVVCFCDVIFIYF
jgi:hypothetical protein